MRGKITLLLVALILMSCGKDEFRTGRGLNYSYGRDIPHEKIVLGERLDNPYTTENMTKALHSLYPTKADRVDVKTTNLYVRFLPENEDEYKILRDTGLELMDHPMDYDIVVDGDWYHDPDVPEDKVTWQYAVVPRDFRFPDIRYELIDECYISENDPGTRSDGIDWEAVEREAYILTGNADMLSQPLTKAAQKYQPAGRITIEDEDFKGGQPFGVAGVRIVCNSFVKIDETYTDRDGYYQMEKSFASDIRYRLVFKNEKGFSIGFNLVLVPASVSTLGKSSPEGVSMTITKDSEKKLFRRCVVNNAAYDYYSRCASEDLGISTPPEDLRIWLFGSISAASAVMLHHGAVLRSDLIEGFLGKFSRLVEYFMPDVTIGMQLVDDYDFIYSTTCHELAHTSHFTKVGTDYWDRYILYIMESYVKSGGKTYGDGSGNNAGYCEIGEMWAYYLESRMYKDRYGGGFPTYGTRYWFYPQIFRFLDERGISPAQIFSVLDADVVSKEDLKTALILAYPDKRTIIDQVFSRY